MRNTLRIVFFHILLMIMFICGCTKDKNIGQIQQQGLGKQYYKMHPNLKSVTMDLVKYG